jgi:hypothetical protein
MLVVRADRPSVERSSPSSSLSQCTKHTVIIIYLKRHILTTLSIFSTILHSWPFMHSWTRTPGYITQYMKRCRRFKMSTPGGLYKQAIYDWCSGANCTHNIFWVAADNGFSWANSPNSTAKLAAKWRGPFPPSVAVQPSLNSWLS